MISDAEHIKNHKISFKLIQAYQHLVIYLAMNVNFLKWPFEYEIQLFLWYVAFGSGSLHVLDFLSPLPNQPKQNHIFVLNLSIHFEAVGVLLGVVLIYQFL